mmetsp:Transcript_100995/g.320589  ORF Transcript_100995/g.320589 Transcript_100995/m.320589 type:complete len:262 (+) Transcript_100995:397-1182(+)
MQALPSGSWIRQHRRVIVRGGDVHDEPDGSIDSPSLRGHALRPGAGARTARGGEGALPAKERHWPYPGSLHRRVLRCLRQRPGLSRHGCPSGGATNLRPTIHCLGWQRCVRWVGRRAHHDLRALLDLGLGDPLSYELQVGRGAYGSAEDGRHDNAGDQPALERVVVVAVVAGRVPPVAAAGLGKEGEHRCRRGWPARRRRGPRCGNDHHRSQCCRGRICDCRPNARALAVRGRVRLVAWATRTAEPPSGTAPCAVFEALGT